MYDSFFVTFQNCSLVVLYVFMLYVLLKIVGSYQPDYLYLPSEKIISCFDDLIVLCSRYKEMKLKYDLEKNVRLVKFLNGQMEFSFNENLDKNFIKNLSRKLFEWTNERWIITLSKEKGQPTRQESKYEIKKNLLNELVNTDFYKKTIEAFPDAELISIDNEEEIK